MQCILVIRIGKALGSNVVISRYKLKQIAIRSLYLLSNNMHVIDVTLFLYLSEVFLV